MIHIILSFRAPSGVGVVPFRFPFAVVCMFSRATRPRRAADGIRRELRTSGRSSGAGYGPYDCGPRPYNVHGGGG